MRSTSPGQGEGRPGVTESRGFVYPRGGEGGVAAGSGEKLFCLLFT